MNTVQVLVSLAVHCSKPLLQYDVKNAFVHGELEEVYMKIPPGYHVTQQENTVCRLKKSLDSLKRSPCTWFGRFSQAMKKPGYCQPNRDHTLFYKHSYTGKKTIIITDSDHEERIKLETELVSEFMKNAGLTKYFLKIVVVHFSDGIPLSQQK